LLSICNADDQCRPINADGNRPQEGSHQEQYFGFFVVQPQSIEDAVKPVAKNCELSYSGCNNLLIMDAGDNIQKVFCSSLYNEINMNEWLLIIICP
jgi:hypothetical protein